MADPDFRFDQPTSPEAARSRLGACLGFGRVTTAQRVHREVTAQARRDRDWPNRQDVLVARVRAVAEAQRALHDQVDECAQWVFRAALIDLAGICELLASELAQPAARLQPKLQPNGG